MNRLLAFLLFACCTVAFAQHPHSKSGGGPTIKRGSSVYIEPMRGYGSYLAAAFMKEHVPIVMVTDRNMADYIVEGKVKHIQPARPGTVVHQTTNVGTSGNDAWDRGWDSGAKVAQQQAAERAAFGYYVTSIEIIAPKSSQIVFADSADKMTVVAKHLKKFIEKRKKHRR